MASQMFRECWVSYGLAARRQLAGPARLHGALWWGCACSQHSSHVEMGLRQKKLKSRAAFDALETAKNWAAFHVAQTIAVKCGERYLWRYLRRDRPPHENTRSHIPMFSSKIAPRPILFTKFIFIGILLGPESAISFVLAPKPATSSF